jgi:flagellar hook protein FlgE
MQTGITGMAAHGQALGVTADNIANAGTNGFKTSRAEFQDIMSRQAGAGGGGSGTKIGNITPVITQGNIDNTSRKTDLAINGEGYFALDGPTGPAYTRNGEFRFDKDGVLMTSDGYKLKGFEVNDEGEITNKQIQIQTPRSLVPARGTKIVRFDMNLDNRVPVAAGGKTFNVDDPYKTADYTTGVEVYDSQGTKHLVTLAFNKKAEGQWEWKALGKGSEVAGADPTKNYAELATGELIFTNEGKLQEQKVTAQNFSFVGAFPNQDVKLNFGDAIMEGGSGLKGTRQFGYNSDLMTWAQDGASAGLLADVSFSDQGILTAVYTNGEEKQLAAVAVAKFENPEGLTKVGNNKLKESRDSGGGALSSAARGGRGSIVAGALERSTTDLASEFVDMIKTQRNFQANAKTITTSDEMLADVINLRR